MGMMEPGIAMRLEKDDAVTMFLSGTHRDSMSVKRSTTKAGFENTQIVYPTFSVRIFLVDSG
jgi:hypothetical protein